jgi:hypothetical protein
VHAALLRPRRSHPYSLFPLVPQHTELTPSSNRRAITVLSRRQSLTPLAPAADSAAVASAPRRRSCQSAPSGEGTRVAGSAPEGDGPPQHRLRRPLAQRRCCAGLRAARGGSGRRGQRRTTACTGGSRATVHVGRPSEQQA